MDYPSNSRKSNEPVPKNIEPIVTGKVVRRKAPLGRRFMETFIQGNAEDVREYLIFDVFFPAMKDTVFKLLTEAGSGMLFGSSRSVGPRTITTQATTGYTTYNRYSAPAQKPAKPTLSKAGRQNHTFDEIVLASRAEAEEAIDRLYGLIETYDFASVADLYKMLNITPEYTDDAYGWTSLKGAQPRATAGGYLLDLPKPLPLD